MSNLDPIPGSRGTTTIIVSVVIVSMLITVITKSLLHWVPVTAGIIVGVWAVQAINK